MAKFFKWFIILLVFCVFALFIVNNITIKHSWEAYYYDENDLQYHREESTEYLDINIFNWYETGGYDLYRGFVEWQDGGFIDGFHDASTALAKTFVPNYIDGIYTYSIASIIYVFMYNLLPLTLLFTCFSVISWIFKLWN